LKTMEPTSTKLITRWAAAEPMRVEDELVVEEPLEIRVGQQSLIVVMRTPGHDFELAAGFLYTESLITSGDDIEIIAYCDEDVTETEDGSLSSLENIVNVQLTEKLDLDAQSGWQRNFHANASCGLCGKMTIESVRQQVSPLNSGFHINQAVLYQLNDRLRTAQSVFEKTGGLHAAGLFDETGELLIVREDIGRHNAVDKVIGQALLSDLVPLERYILMVSGRASFEIVQKALFARIPVVVAVSAASTLAVDLAQEGNLTLVGFMRGQSMAVYTCPERVLRES
ncbi:MAG: formate dehydrogenase accessory sulfurtransferase FdhD, partial [Candidatus Poribacteria bacterium]|nr:formate dehydrogenase accessory sulfurtransferase FdhD [Candidatus Poribacteria bacterium]